MYNTSIQNPINDSNNIAIYLIFNHFQPTPFCKQKPRECISNETDKKHESFSWVKSSITRTFANSFTTTLNLLRLKRKSSMSSTTSSFIVKCKSLSRRNVRSFHEGHRSPSKSRPFACLHADCENRFGWQQTAWPSGCRPARWPSRRDRRHWPFEAS